MLPPKTHTALSLQGAGMTSARPVAPMPTLFLTAHVTQRSRPQIERVTITNYDYYGDYFPPTHAPTTAIPTATPGTATGFFITSELVVDWIYDLTCARAVGVIPPYVSECC